VDHACDNIEKFRKRKPASTFGTWKKVAKTDGTEYKVVYTDRKILPVLKKQAIRISECF
jgi:hypothetical protein